MKSASAVSLPHPEAVQTPIHERDIADVAVIALTSEALTGQAPVLTGPERLTLREQVDTISAVIRRPVAVIEQTEAQASDSLSRHLPDVWVRQIIKDWRRAVDTSPAISNEYERITANRSRSFRTWVEEHAALFR